MQAEGHGRPAYPARIRLVLRPVPQGPDQHGRDPWYRLKVLLKRAWRAHGLQCLSAVAVEDDEGDLP